MPLKLRGLHRHGAMASDTAQPQDMLMPAISMEERSHPILFHSPSIRLLTNESGYAQIVVIQIGTTKPFEKAPFPAG
jgi:hypothetical protein